jgi:Ser/Thr protein kinase RdoA (MazF antagonist)
VHGDPKEANFCFGPAGVAAVDFQYTGRACAMTDVAYLLYGRRDEPQDGNGIDEARLATYFAALRARLPAGVDGAALEAEWRALYPYARLDFCRFLAGWRPAMWAHDRRGQAFVRACFERGVC